MDRLFTSDAGWRSNCSRK